VQKARSGRPVLRGEEETHGEDRQAGPEEGLESIRGVPACVLPVQGEIPHHEGGL